MIHACCGHGKGKAYIVYADAEPGTPCTSVECTILRGDDALAHFASLGVGPETGT